MTKEDLYKRKGLFLRAIDGDGFWMNVELGWKATLEIDVRIARIDAPELKDPDPVIRKAALDAKKFVQALLLKQKVWIDSKKLDPYGRSISEAYFDVKGLPDMKNPISDIIVAAGHASYHNFNLKKLAKINKKPDLYVEKGLLRIEGMAVYTEDDAKTYLKKLKTAA